MQSTQIMAMYGTDGFDMVQRLLEQMDAVSHLPQDKHASIAIKPNLVVAHTADTGATTHPEIIEGIICYLQAQGYDNLSIIESSWVGDQTMRAYEVCGYNALSKRRGVPLYDMKKEPGVQVQTHGISLSVCKRALEADAIINVPVLKAHCQTALTCALKNLKGLVPDKEKRRYHQLGIHQPVALLNTVLRPAFTIVDGLCGDLTFEEGGNPVPMQRLLAGLDSVLIDSYAAQLLGYDPDEIEMLPMARGYGVGAYFEDESQLIELNSPADLPQKYTPSRRANMLARRVDAKNACSACYGSLIFALNRLDELGELPRETLHIGQGYQGIEGDGIGIGRCCAGFSRCLKGCPPQAKDIVDFLQK